MSIALDYNGIASLLASQMTRNETETNTMGTYIVFGSGIAVQLHIGMSLFQSATEIKMELFALRYDGSWDSINSHTLTRSSAGTSNSDWFVVNGSNYITDINTSYSSCIFRVVCSSRGGGNATIRIRPLTMGAMSESEYNAVVKGNPVRFCEPDYWRIGGTYPTEDACILAQEPYTHRGEEITEAKAYGICACPYHIGRIE